MNKQDTDGLSPSATLSDRDILTEKYKTLQAKSKQYGENNDCSVIALAMVYDLTYEESHTICHKLGRRARGSFATIKAVRQLGRHSSIIAPKQPNGSRYTVKTIASTVPVGKYLVWTSGHILACINGTIYDWTEDRKHRVKRYVEIDSLLDML